MQVEVIVRAVQVDRQQVNGVVAVLLAIRLGLDQQHFLGQPVRGVGLLGIAVPQVFFAEGHRRELGIGADRANGNELVYAFLPGFVHQRNTHNQILVEKFSRAGAVGANPAGKGSKMDQDIRFGVIEHAVLVFHCGQVVIFDPGHKDVLCAALAELFKDEGAKESSPTGHTNTFILPKF